ncbi:MAG: hypothetical protein IKY00_04950 [Clostridia bacterium]|nr:hypothetical protein [Clostridia bacterium]
MDKIEYEAIINRTVPSRQMREFLCLQENELSSSELAEVIIGSPKITIDEKYDLLCSLTEETGDKRISEYVAEYVRDFKAAIDNLVCAPGELFTVDDPWYDEDIKDVAYGGFNQPCADYNKVIEYIDLKYKYEECDSDSCTWFVIKKWASDEESRFINTYIYYFLYGIGICWFAACSEHGDEGPYSRLPEHHKYSSSCIDLNIATPFRAGDIVRIDCRPFAPPVNALILYAGPDWDCCSLLALYRDDKGRYRTGAVKHTDMWMHLRGDNMISALYRLETYDGELSEYDRIYKEISPLIYGDNKKGDKVWNYLNENRAFTSPGELLGKVKELFEEK